MMNYLTFLPSVSFYPCRIAIVFLLQIIRMCRVRSQSNSFTHFRVIW